MLILNLFSAGSRPRRVPIFPLNTVLFPGSALPLRIFEVRYVDMARDCLRTSSPFGVCLIKEGEEVGAPAVPERIGCLARIGDCDAEELGVLKVRAIGLERLRIVSSEVTKPGLIVAEVEPLAAEPEVSDAPGLADCAGFLRKAIAAIGVERFVEPLRFDDATWVGFRLAEILPLRIDVKQKLLELTDATLRLAVLDKFLRQQGLIA
ncbi:MAG TPA: LON peptidase substrate-binding domain-containing protein [Usitatibacter sp.]|nr:LON peptidase substrate-binding domain-containing protein [Usitatibacter sp.]